MFRAHSDYTEMHGQQNIKITFKVHPRHSRTSEPNVTADSIHWLHANVWTWHARTRNTFICKYDAAEQNDGWATRRPRTTPDLDNTHFGNIAFPKQ